MKHILLFFLLILSTVKVHVQAQATLSTTDFVTKVFSGLYMKKSGLVTGFSLSFIKSENELTYFSHTSFYSKNDTIVILNKDLKALHFNLDSISHAIDQFILFSKSRNLFEEVHKASSSKWSQRSEYIFKPIYQQASNQLTLKLSTSNKKFFRPKSRAYYMAIYDFNTNRILSMHRIEKAN